MRLNITPGRWVVGFGHQHAFRLYQGSLDGAIIADFNCVGGVATGLEAQANLELCAAAPELRRSIEVLLEKLSIDDDEGLMEYSEPVFAVRAALAKSYGGGK